MEGWIKLHRRFISWEWFETENMVKLFIFLLLSANHKPGKWRGIDVDRGQLITGLNSLSEKTKISMQSLRTCLSRLEKTGEINTKSTNKYRMITICNYDSYQDEQHSTNKQPNKQVTINQQTTNNQLTTNKNNKNDNNVKNDNKDIPTYDIFKSYALEKKKNIDVNSLRLKYDSWIENDWKDGNDKPIKNWRSKLLNTLQYIKEVQTVNKGKKWD